MSEGTQQNWRGKKREGAVGHVLDRRYRIVRVLGAGAFGKTYLAADLRRPGYPHCVVKQLRLLRPNPTALKNAHRLFKREAEMLQKLGSHPQIPQLLAYFQENKRFYLVKEFTPGHPLSQEIQLDRPLPERRTLAIVTEILEILTFVHGHGVIHRDIKPANLIRRDRDGRLVLIDFGSVKEIVDNQNGAAARTIAAGTPAYMPPEQFYGNPQLNSDLYAVGIVAIQALAGLSSEDLQNLRGDKNAPAGKVNWRHLAQVSPEFANIIDKMVHPTCAKRYPSAEAVLADLRQLQGQGTGGSPSGTGTSGAGSGAGATSTAVWDGAATVDSDAVRPWWRSSLGNASQRRGVWAAAAVAALLAAAWVAGVPQGAIARYWAARARQLAPPTHLDATREGQATAADRDRLARRIAGAGTAQGEEALDYARAASQYSRALRWRSSPALFYQRGLTYYNLGNWQAALRDFDRALQADPDRAAAAFYRASARAHLGDRQGAARDYDRALELDPELAAAYLGRGHLRLDGGEATGALADFNQAVELDADWAAAHRGRSLARLAAGDATGALDDATEAIRLNSDDGGAYEARGRARLALGDNSKAIADLNVALGLNPKAAEPYYHRAVARRALGERQGAIADLNEAIRLNPDLAEAYYQRGLLQADLGNGDAAEHDFRQSAKLCLDSGQLDCYRQARDRLEARAADLSDLAPPEIAPDP